MANESPLRRVDIECESEGCMMPFLKGLLVTAVATPLLLPATAIAKQSEGKRQLRIAVHPKYPLGHRWRGYGFLPGYRQPPDLADWRDRSARYRGPYARYELRYWSGGEFRYGWGGPGFYRGRWNGGSFGPCWTSTPIGQIWNCGM
jgi:hypothetical protein